MAIITIERPDGSTYEQLVDIIDGKINLKEVREKLGKGYHIVDVRIYE